MRIVSNRLMRFAASAVFVLCPASALAQPIPKLNAQLKQAVDSSRWSQAIQVVEQMVVAEPEQADRLEIYKQQLQRLRDSQKAPSVFSSKNNSVSATAAGLGKVAVTNAFVARREWRRRDFFRTQSWADPFVKYDLRVELYNGTSGTAKEVHVYYDILSWNKDYNESGSLVIPDIQADRKLRFEESLQGRAVPQDSRNRYEGVRVRINRVEWFNEDGSSGSNDTPIKFGYWGKVGSDSFDFQ
jgi:hypothetical protein